MAKDKSPPSEAAAEPLAVPVKAEAEPLEPLAEPLEPLAEPLEPLADTLAVDVTPEELTLPPVEAPAEEVSQEQLDRIRTASLPSLYEARDHGAGMPEGLALAIRFEIQSREFVATETAAQQADSRMRLRILTPAMRLTKDGFFADVPVGDLFPLSEGDVLTNDGIAFEVVTVEQYTDGWGHSHLKVV